MVSVGFKTDRGAVRTGNEDSLFVMPDQNLYIVADGVGGHNSGELASRMAVSYIAQYVAINPVTAIDSKIQLKRYFKNCFEGANELVYNKAGEDPAFKGMATTAVLCCIKDGWCYIVNVGDSRAYLVRDGELRQITEDHTCVRNLVNSGVITEAQALTHPDRNMITRAIGGDSFIVPDYFQFELCPEDIIILCSDGLYGEVPADTMLQIIEASGSSMHRLAKSLVAEANRSGGKDNISVVCLKNI